MLQIFFVFGADLIWGYIIFDAVRGNIIHCIMVTVTAVRINKLMSRGRHRRIGKVQYSVVTLLCNWKDDLRSHATINFIFILFLFDCCYFLARRQRRFFIVDKFTSLYVYRGIRLFCLNRLRSFCFSNTLSGGFGTRLLLHRVLNS